MAKKETEVTEIKESKNFGNVIGTLQEMNLKLDNDYEVTLDTGKKVKCKAIVKEDFKNPSITIDVNGTPIGVNYFPTAEVTKKNEENKGFKSMMTVLENYIDKVHATDEKPATRLKANCKLGLNEYVNDKEELSSFPQLMGQFQPTSTNVPEKDIVEVEISGVVRAIKDETKGEDGDTTGRLLVTFFMFDNKGALKPFELVVEEDLAEDFKEIYEVGCSCKLYIELISKTVGVVKVKKSGGMGRHESNISSGYEKIELSVFKGEDPIEDDDEGVDKDYFVSMADVKTAMKERDIWIEAKKKDKKDNPKGKGKSTTKSKGLGTRPSSIQEDLPFDEESTDIEDPFS